MKDENIAEEWDISLLIEIPSFLHINTFFVVEKNDMKIPCVAFQIGEEEEEFAVFDEFLRKVKQANEQVEELEILMKMLDMMEKEE